MRYVVVVLALVGCQPRSELMIGFATDLKTPDELGNIQLQVTRVSDGLPEAGDGETWTITNTIDEPYNLPASYGIYSDDQDVQLDVTLTGTVANEMPISQRAVLSVVSGQTLFYRIGLTSLCESPAMACSPTQTCSEGKCIDAVVNAGQLPKYDASLVDTLTCIGAAHYIHTDTGEPMALSADAASCPAGRCVNGLCLNAPTGGGGGNFATNTYVKPGYVSPGAEYGESIAISADGMTIVVGGPDDALGGTGIDPVESPMPPAAATSGGAYVYTATGTSWSQQAYIKSDNDDPQDHFGMAVALSADGTTLAVGAPGEQSNATGIDGDETNNTRNNAGAVYVFVRSGATWTQQAYVKPPFDVMTGFFGKALALSADGNTLAVGEYGESSDAIGIDGDPTDTSRGGSGAAFVFTRSGTTWSQQAYVKASNPDFLDGFGAALALSADGNTLAVGAYNEASGATGVDGDQTDNTEGGAGAVYMFTRASTTWSQQAYIKASNTRPTAAFGTAVSLAGDGNTLAVGAYTESSNATGVGGDQSNTLAAQSGAAYVFTRSGTTWAQQVYIKASNTTMNTDFGSAISLSSDGSTLAVGSSQEDSSATGVGGDQTNQNAPQSGATYVFAQTAGTWSQSAYVKAANTRPMAQFGSSVALSMTGSVLVVGSPTESSGSTGVGGDPSSTSAPETGAAYIYQ